MAELKKPNHMDYLDYLAFFSGFAIGVCLFLMLFALLHFNDLLDFCSTVITRGG